MLGMGLQPQDEINYIPGTPSTAGMLGGSLLQGLGEYGPMALSQMFNNDYGQQGDGGQQGAGGADAGGKMSLAQRLIPIVSGTASGAMKGGHVGAAVGGGMAALTQLLQYLGSRNSGQQQSGNVQLDVPRYKI